MNVCFMRKALTLVFTLMMVVVLTSPEQSAAANGRLGKPLKFAPPPVDLDFNRDGPKKEATPAQRKPATTPKATQKQQTPPKQQASPAAAQPTAVPAAASPAPNAGGTPEKIRLFGTIEFKGKVKKIPKWERVLNEERKLPTFPNYKERMPASVRPKWEAMKQTLKNKPLKEKLQQVNTLFNQWQYKKDIAVWGVEDYWATPAEFMKKSGDCEDYAIVKYYALRDLGVPAEQLRVVALTDTLYDIGHAVLVVYMDGDAYVLDNVTNLILSHKRLPHYKIVFSTNEEFLWRHATPLN